MTPSSPDQPLYVRLGLNLDAPHPAKNLPASKPEAAKGQTLLEGLPQHFLNLEYYQTHSPDQAWDELRAESSLASLQDDQIWDLVAAIWSNRRHRKPLKREPAVLQPTAPLAMVRRAQETA